MIRNDIVLYRRYGYIVLVSIVIGMYYCYRFFFFQAEDGIRDLVRSRGLGDVYKRQMLKSKKAKIALFSGLGVAAVALVGGALLYSGVMGLSLIHI